MGRNSTNNDSSSTGAQFMSVVSPNGFLNGDLVYRTPSGYGLPSGAITSATFSNKTAAPINVPAYAESSTIGIHPDIMGGGYNDFAAAELTNGNVVVVYSRPNTNAANTTFPYFTIFDATGAIVVSETLIDGTNSVSTYPNVSVCALSGGGFAVWYNTGATSAFYYAHFNNAGVVTVSPTSAAFGGINSANLYLKLYPRFDNTYIVAYPAVTTGYPRRAIYNSTGTQTVAPADISTTAAVYEQQHSIAVFSDNTFLSAYMTASNSATWNYLDSSGTSTATGTIAATYSISVSALNSGNAAVYYVGSTSRLSHRLFTKSTSTMGSETQVYAGSLGLDAIMSMYSHTKSGTNTNLVLFGLNSGQNVLPYSGIASAVVNGETGALAGDGNFDQNLPWATFSRWNVTTSFEVGSNVRFYTRSAIFSGQTPSTSFRPPTAYMDYDLTTLKPRNFTSVSGLPRGNSGALSVSSYARSNSTPATASFFAAATTPTRSTVSAGDVLIPLTVVDSNVTSLRCIRLKRLQSGNFVYAYSAYNITLSLTQLHFKVYNTSGVEQAYVVVASPYNTIATYDFDMDILADGKILFVYADSAATNRVRFKTYSGTTYAQIAAGELTTTNIITSSGFNISVAGLTYGNRFALAYITTTNTLTCTVYSDSGAVVSTPISSISANLRNAQVLPTDSGGFFITFFFTTLAALQAVKAWRYDATNYQYNSAYSVGANNADVNFSPGVKNSAVSPSGQIMNYYKQNGTNNFYSDSVSPVPSAYAQLTTGTLPYAAGNTNYACTVNDDNYFISFAQASSGSDRTRFSSAKVAETNRSSISMNAIPVYTAGHSNLAMDVCPFYGPFVVWGFAGVSDKPSFGVFAANAGTYPFEVTAGISTSNTTTISTSNGFSLIGTAASACAAAGSGQVQTRGTAVLNSQYPTTTENFDFTNPATYGVRGSVSNRVITMEDQ